MRLFCWNCKKSVSNDLPEDTIFRGIAYCPECIESGAEQIPNAAHLPNGADSEHSRGARHIAYVRRPHERI